MSCTEAELLSHAQCVLLLSEGWTRQWGPDAACLGPTCSAVAADVARSYTQAWVLASMLPLGQLRRYQTQEQIWAEQAMRSH